MTNDANQSGSAVTNGDRADRRTVIRLLNGALATEIVCVLRYQRHHFTARRLHAKTVAREFLAYANEEQRHAEMIRYFGDDPTSRRLLEEILVHEEQHAGDLTALIDILRCETRGPFFAARAPSPRHKPARPLELEVDRARRIDSSIDYFGSGDDRCSADPCGEALLDGDGAS
jgi:hypothetical protein